MSQLYEYVEYDQLKVYQRRLSISFLCEEWVQEQLQFRAMIVYRNATFSGINITAMRLSPWLLASSYRAYHRPAG